MDLGEREDLSTSSRDCKWTLERGRTCLPPPGIVSGPWREREDLSTSSGDCKWTLERGRTCLPPPGIVSGPWREGGLVYLLQGL